MNERYKIKVAVFLILTKNENEEEYVLLQRRFNTGILDGKYDVSASGHLEEGETLIEAMIRETKEEINVGVSKEDLDYVSTIHAKFDDSEYLLIAFHANKYEDIPEIMEKDKCDELSWFPINELPDNIIDTRKMMIKNYQTRKLYSEYSYK